MGRNAWADKALTTIGQSASAQAGSAFLGMNGA
jgi:hypothetical protein